MLSSPIIDKSHIAFYNDSQTQFFGRVIQEPDIGISGAKYVVAVNAVSSQTRSKKSIKGCVLVNAPLYPQYQFGDFLQVSCRLQAPKNFDDSRFNYVKYLAKDDIYSICYRPSISLLSQKPKRLGLMSIIFSLKSLINTQVEKLWPEPQSSLMAGLLYGARAGLPLELKDDFSRVGITHIIAISGYNISIIASVLMTVLIAAGLYRRQAFWVCVAGIILFVLFTGASASVMRAGIMGIIVLIAQQLGRLSRLGNVLALTAALMLLANPYILIWDAGFQLSFLATMGLVYLSPVIQPVILSAAKNLSCKVKNVKILRCAQDDSWANSSIVEVLVSTLSAIIATLPLILFQFGRLSIVAPIVNVLVLWIIPWLMLFGFMAVILSTAFYPVGQLIAWIAGVGLKYVIIVAQWFASLRFASWDINVGAGSMVVMYVLLIIIIYESQSKNSRFKDWLRSRGR